MSTTGLDLLGTCDDYADRLPDEEEITAPASGPHVVTLSDVRPERVAYLWPGRLARGKLIVADGDPSTGKSTLMLDIAARVSRPASRGPMARSDATRPTCSS